jgi:hypothetical protein
MTLKEVKGDNMKIKKIIIANNNFDERLNAIFQQLGAKPKQVEDQEVLSIVTTPQIMSTKMDIAYEQLKRLGYDNMGKSMQHFWYISDGQKRLPYISVESQGSEGFVKEKHEYLIYW